MKKLFFGALLMVGMTAIAQEGKPLKPLAQREASAEKREQQQLKRLTVELGLDATQQKELAEILEDRTEKREALKAEHQANKEKGVKTTPEQRKERRAEMDAFRDEQDAKIKKILRGDQVVKWEKIKGAEKERRNAKMQQKGDNIKKSE